MQIIKRKATGADATPADRAAFQYPFQENILIRQHFNALNILYQFRDFARMLPEGYDPKNYDIHDINGKRYPWGNSDL